MIASGPVELTLGIRAERRSLEDIACPLTVHDDPARAGMPAQTRSGSPYPVPAG
jgi:hypothetical protein